MLTQPLCALGLAYTHYLYGTGWPPHLHKSTNHPYPPHPLEGIAKRLRYFLSLAEELRQKQSCSVKMLYFSTTEHT
jgi:hypothetical protein